MLNRLLAKSSRFKLLVAGAGSGINATGDWGIITGSGSMTGAAITGSATLITVGIGASN